LTAPWRAFDELMELAGSARPSDLAIEEGATALETRFFAEEACAAVLAACGTTAADIWVARGGKPQAVGVATREAAASLTSFLHNRFEDAARMPLLVREERTPANGFFRTRDERFVYLHQSFPESAARLHALMGSPADKAQAAQAVLGWDAKALEDAIAERGLCGALARTAQEWDASEQGRVLAATAVVEVTRIGEADPEPLPAGPTPLAGVRTLDLTRVLAGPTCAKALAAFGAEVLHLTSPTLPTVEMFVADTNPGKRSAFLDLKAGKGRELLEGLVRGADVFSQGYRAGALDRLGFGPARLAQLRPGIVCVEIDCYGHDGPWRERPGWEQLAQTATGMAVMHGDHQGEDGPKLQPAAVNDYTTGYLAAFGALIALDRRAQSGGSWLVRVSLSRTAMWVRSLGLAEGTIEPLSVTELDAWRVDESSGWGPMRRLRPPVRMSETPAVWTRPAVRLGTDRPDWA
jgi:crotonobetainyl-CoA:carnitine CoA-transferase CaiB-like acyl-CoA transferase